MAIKNEIQLGINITFWGVNPYFSKLANILKQKNVHVEEYTTRINNSNHTSIGTPSIVVFKGIEASNKLEESEMRDLIVSHEPLRDVAEANEEPSPPENFMKTSQVSGFAASFLRAHGYTVNTNIVNDLDEVQKIDFDLDSGIRFDLIDPNQVDPAVLRKELGLNW